MGDLTRDRGAPIDVAVIGGGPSGLAAATALKSAGVARVVLLERDTAPGGVPRHCGHPPFGMREFGRVLRGPAYAARLVARARDAGVEIHPMTTVTALRPGGVVQIVTPKGQAEIAPRRVVLATGLREATRAARLISGVRGPGVMNTGALQAMVYLHHRRPFRRPVIIGSELVAFSAILTCRHAGIAPVAMIEAAPRITARWPVAVLPALAGVRVLTGTRLLAIHGEAGVSGARLSGADGAAWDMECDGVILSGDFIPEATLARLGPLEIDAATGGPRVDQWGRCSDPAFFATGNLLRPVETAGWCWAEGRRTGAWVARDLAGGLPAPGPEVRLVPGDSRLKYVMPQVIARPGDGVATGDTSAVQLRLSASVRGALCASDATGVIWRRRLNSHPERRILVPISAIVGPATQGPITFSLDPPEG